MVNLRETENKTAYYHLPGLFEFFELYCVFLPLFREHREYFYDWCEIGSIYGAPADCIWGGGRVGFGDYKPREVLALMQEYGISARLTFLKIVNRGSARRRERPFYPARQGFPSALVEMRQAASERGALTRPVREFRPAGLDFPRPLW